MNPPRNSAGFGKRAFRLLQWVHWFLIAAIAIVVLGFWLWTAPRGFPWFDPRASGNLVVPLLALFGSVIACLACFRRHPMAVHFIAILPGLTAGLLVGCLAFYPTSMRTFVGLILAGGLAYLLLSFTIFWGSTGTSKARSIGILCLFFLIGIAWARTQRAPDPSTKLLNDITLPVDTTMQPENSEMLQFTNGRSHLFVQPFLRFISLSPDRFWTVFAPRQLPSTSYALERRSDHEVIVWSELATDQFSHLNTFTELQFKATGTISISFSPCPEQRIEVQPFDYPYGEPARFAYLGADERFFVVEAKTGEKGPFTELASAPCARDHKLKITLYAGEQAMFELTFEDFFAQCSTDLSPTAGWGVPQNSIEFSLISDGMAAVHMSLASTSVGRGFDSVGHHQGLYRNRLSISHPE